ncbi:preprotein translocase subunit YajC [Nocardioides currus]|uniref:Preprotein translocase subunit YajC n=1 Tax=Nocardioides currus TaxID=2133958 RepID=A0A2R7YW42_9ACTN|nr:preprotein translocase subunit YajC [Nocardioides currus]PUA80099.1 preprotein translocase subunit YajC [Nocardioides currus]
MGELATFLPLIAVAVLFWLMVVRPASRRQKAVAQLQSELRPGQRVMLSSGIYGTVTSLDEDRVHLEIAPGTTIEVARGAVSVVDQGPDVAVEAVDTDETDRPGEER